MGTGVANHHGPGAMAGICSELEAQNTQPLLTWACSKGLRVSKGGTLAHPALGKGQMSPSPGQQAATVAPHTGHLWSQSSSQSLRLVPWHTGGEEEKGPSLESRGTRPPWAARTGCWALPQFSLQW